MSSGANGILIDNSMRCIYCGVEGKLSEEHWFPESLGKFKNYEKLKGKICRDCNGKTKLAEQALARYGVTGMHRSMLGIEGKRNKREVRKNPFYWMLKELPPQELKMSFPGLPCRVYAEFIEDGSLAAARQFIVKRGGEIFAVLLPEWVQDPESLQRFLAKKQLKEGMILHVMAHKDHARKTFKRLFPNKRDVSPQFWKPDGKVHYTWTVATGALHARAVAKIAFHYLLKMWGDKYWGTEPEFDEIKKFIQGDQPLEMDWRRFAACAKEDLKTTLGVPKQACHGIALVRTEHRIEARMCLFYGGKHCSTKWTWIVNLGKAPGRMIWEDSVAHVFFYFPKKQGPFHGEVLKGGAVVTKKKAGQLPLF